MDVEWCGVLVTPPPKYHTFSLKIPKNEHIFPNLETAVETVMGQYIQLSKFV